MGNSFASILVVDDEPDLRTLYELTLLREGYRVETAGNLQQARAHLEVCRFDVLITDMRLPDGMGMELLHDLRNQRRKERAIVMTAYGSADNAVEALRCGAFDYLTKPVDLKQFRSVVASAVRGASGALATPASPASLVPASHHEDALSSGYSALERLVGTSLAMQQVKQRIQRVAQSMAPVLVTGESGTGKELVARALHACSHRGQGPWVAVNCGAIPEHLLEAEFFGARKGAYTGANADREGFFSAARGGTLFFDEIGELPLSMQAKLLRAIQERCVRPLGATHEEPVDVRIVSATHRDLAKEVQAGRFRQDLYYRLNVIDIPLLALRERREDLPALCNALLQKILGDQAAPHQVLTPQLLEQLQFHPLLGNVRELENILHRAIALGDQAMPSAEPVLFALATPVPATTAPAEFTHVPPLPSLAPVVSTPLPQAPVKEDLPHDLQAWLDEQERDILMRALHACGYNRTAAAARLGISLRQIRYRIARLNIPLGTEETGASGDNALYDTNSSSS